MLPLVQMITPFIYKLVSGSSLHSPGTTYLDIKHGIFWTLGNVDTGIQAHPFCRVITKARHSVINFLQNTVDPYIW